jgi:hypothetical protein
MKVIDPHGGFDINAAHETLAIIEKRQGWRSEKNARYVVNEQGRIVPRPKPKNAKPKPKQPALDFECATGEKSAQRIAQERGHAIIQNAASWVGLHEKLAGAGLRLEKKGSGAIIFVGEIAVKASSVDRAFSLKKLEKRLGAFAPGEYPAEIPKPTPEPVSVINIEEWRRYQAERQGLRHTPPPSEQSAALAAMKARHAEERRRIPVRIARRAPGLLNFSRKLLKFQHQKERSDLRAQMRKHPKGKGSLPRFEDWLRAKGLHKQAEKWRHRRFLETVPQRLRTAKDYTADHGFDPAALYNDLRQNFLRQQPNTDPSFLDAYIALNLRRNGFSEEETVRTIEQCVPAHQPEQADRDWRRYAERAAAFAFGVEGDVWMNHGEEQRQKSEAEQARIEAEARERAKAEERPQPPRFRLR